MRTSPYQKAKTQPDRVATPTRPPVIAMPGWVLLPLRLFLGITFIYAGVQKLTDPQFFNPAAPGYIGRQLIAFATGTPLHALLINVVVPHASFFGGLVAYGEIAIGLGALAGFLLRPAAFFGIVLSLIFFLSASWKVYPYFYGADIVFVFCWLTLLLSGPTNTGYGSLDEVIVPRLLDRADPQQRPAQARLYAYLLGVGERQDTAYEAERLAPVTPGRGGNRGQAQRSRYAIEMQQRAERRKFLTGLVTGGAGMLGLAWLWSVFHTSATATTTGNSTATTPATSATAGASGTASTSGGAIAQVSKVQNNSAVNFTIASNGDPGVLVRLKNGQFVAYDAVCTHAGCTVDYDPTSQMLICPCHGAAFDPAQKAAATQGPTSTPLNPVTIHVDNASGNITAG